MAQKKSRPEDRESSNLHIAAQTGRLIAQSGQPLCKFIVRASTGLLIEENHMEVAERTSRS
ncbi:hypothetical protein D3871_05055 [Noviherbaspirillum saxi]|uniref:Uncharacterized protein n=1 Tax=Noviherbaspirillum saxi TaxID=2320863 RepID=A0A3A3FPL5_9BURK|nr:hypothetical protein D3871_05055 [Noviherbaspirillum saxi]